MACNYDIRGGEYLDCFRLCLCLLHSIGMLSLEKCRELIPDSNKLSDQEIDELRKALYDMAELALEVYFHRKKQNVATFSKKFD